MESYKNKGDKFPWNWANLCEFGRTFRIWADLYGFGHLSGLPWLDVWPLENRIFFISLVYINLF